MFDQNLLEKKKREYALATGEVGQDFIKFPLFLLQQNHENIKKAIAKLSLDPQRAVTRELLSDILTGLLE